MPEIGTSGSGDSPSRRLLRLLYLRLDVALGETPGANETTGARPGCLLVNTAVEVAPHDRMPPAVVGAFRSFRSPEGETMVLENNVFVENVIPAAIIRKLNDEEMVEYRRPFADPGEGRRPTLTFPRQIPIDGEPADVTEFVRAYGAWLNESEIPKLFVNADPGMVINDKHRAFCRKFHNQREVTVAGLHYIQEDSPHEIGRAIADWYRRLDD